MGQHSIKSNTRSSSPSHVIALDVQMSTTKITNTEYRNRFEGATLIYRRYRWDRGTWTDQSYSTADKEALWGWIIAHAPYKARKWIFVAGLEERFLAADGWKHLVEWGGQCKRLSLDDQRVIYEWSHDSKTIRFVDANNLFRGKVDGPGATITVKRVSLASPAPDRQSEGIGAGNSCRHLLQTLHTWITFVRDEDLGNFAPTLAGQAWNAWRHRFYRHRIYHHGKPRVMSLEREAYRGGRNESYYFGDLSGVPWTLLDIRSMYPSIMAKTPLPFNLISTGKELTQTGLRKMLAQFGVIAHCVIRSDEPYYMVKGTQGCTFPTGTFSATLSTPEIIHALDNKHFLGCRMWAAYEQAILFSDYVQFFWGARRDAEQRGDTLRAMICKLLMNSLYGRFGMRYQNWEPDGGGHMPGWDKWSEIDAQTGEISNYRAINGMIEKQMGWIEGNNILTAICTHITAWGRDRLWQIMQRAGREHVAYCDTDSVIVDSDGLKNLEGEIENNTLGALRVQQQSDVLIIGGEKNYRMGDTIRRSGIKAEAEEIRKDTFRQFIRMGVKSLMESQGMGMCTRRRIILRARKQTQTGRG